MPANFQRFDDSTNLDLPFDRVEADLIVEFPRLNADRRIRYATCSWNQSARFHSLNQNRGRAETGQTEREFWKKKHAAALFFRWRSPARARRKCAASATACAS